MRRDVIFKEGNVVSEKVSITERSEDEQSESICEVTIYPISEQVQGFRESTSFDVIASRVLRNRPKLTLPTRLLECVMIAEKLEPSSKKRSTPMKHITRNQKLAKK